MKILFAFILGLSLFSGCQTENKHGYYIPCEKQQINPSLDFNKEVYIWENFVFPTNKVEIR